MQNPQTTYLVLADGSIHPGKHFGAEPTNRFSEMVFTTGMSGYLETLTDPSYSSQIIIQTFPLIGNYGFIPEDLESSKAYCTGYVVRHLSDTHSNFRSIGDLDSWLKKQGVTGIEGVDTRALTRQIREEGVMNAVITFDPDSVDMAKLRAYREEPQVPLVSEKDTRTYPAMEQKKFQVALMDTGVKKSIISDLQELGCEVNVFPWDTDPKAILAGNPDGILLGNGPGDPRDYAQLIDSVKVFQSTDKPIMGICLGHQLMALSSGFSIKKMKYGHRGENQGVQNLKTKNIYMTSQNHGYLVENESVNEEIAEISFLNVNDGTCEGIDYRNKPQFSVQFHPEASAGPLETRYLFERFTSMMEDQNATR